jgi:hypothetical protein
MNTSQTGRGAATSTSYGPLALARVCGPVVIILLLALRPVLAETPDDQYLRIYGMIEQGDALQTKGQADQALAKYREALAALQAFDRDHRDWNPKLLAYRFKYLADKVAALSAPPPEPAKTNAPAASSEAQPEAKSAPSASEKQVKVTEPGAEPRKELRLHPKPGDKQTATMTLKTTVDTAMEGMPGQTVKAPTIKMTYDTTVKSVSQAGDISYEVVIKEASVPDEPGVLPQAVEPLKTALAGMRGLSGTGTISSRGQSKGFEFEFPANAALQTRQLVDQMKDAFVNLAVSLPEAALGAGAKWEQKEAIKSQGATIDQTSTYELASVEAERMVIKSAVAQSAANQKVEVPSMPGMKLKLTKFAGKGTVSTAFDLGQLLPTDKSTDLHTEQYLTLDAGGQPQALVSKTDVSLRITAK